MRIAYVNTYFQSNHTGGGHVHMGQFVANAVALGHEVWAYPSSKFPEAHTIPITHYRHIKTMRQMDALYVRLEHKPPEVCSWALPPRRSLYGFPLVIWEFNTIPDEGLMRGEPGGDIQKSTEYLRHYGKGCDLAICMTNSLGEYVQTNYGINRVLIVPNGSDPDLFRPDLPSVKRMAPYQDKFNVVWIGSAKIAYHDFEMMRNAAQLLWDRGEGNLINFHIIGPGLASEMADMPPNVFYWGAETYERIPNWLAGMDVGLSLYHPGPADVATPLKVFDYLACGLPVLSTPQPFMNNLSRDLDQSDLIISSGDSEALARKLIDLASDLERVKRLGLAGRQLVVERYNWRRAVQDTMDEMKTILKEKGRVPKA